MVAAAIKKAENLPTLYDERVAATDKRRERRDCMKQLDGINKPLRTNAQLSRYEEPHLVFNQVTITDRETTDKLQDVMLVSVSAYSRNNIGLDILITSVEYVLDELELVDKRLEPTDQLLQDLKTTRMYLLRESEHVTAHRIDDYLDEVRAIELLNTAPESDIVRATSVETRWYPATRNVPESFSGDDVNQHPIFTQETFIDDETTDALLDVMQTSIEFSRETIDLHILDKSANYVLDMLVDNELEPTPQLLEGLNSTRMYLQGSKHEATSDRIGHYIVIAYLRRYHNALPKPDLESAIGSDKTWEPVTHTETQLSPKGGQQQKRRESEKRYSRGQHYVNQHPGQTERMNYSLIAGAMQRAAAASRGR